MPTKAVLLKENEQLLKERDALQRKYDTLKTRKAKVESKMVAAGLLEEQRELTQDYKELVQHRDKTAVNLAGHKNAFIHLPWWKRLTFTREQLKFWFHHGEL